VTLDDSYTVANAEVMSGDYVMIAVSDTGCGMSSEVTNRVFEPFFTTKAVGRGSGLGLSMVYGFVKQSEGHIKLYSEVGRGTSIKIYLPRTTSARKPGPEAGDTTKEALAAPRAARLVLVVEDDQDVLKLTAAMVESLGYDVITAETGDTALPLIEAHHDIALLLTDVMLPGSLHGPSLAERAQALRPGLPVLFVSGYAENAIIESGVLAPGVNLLSKPFRKSDLQRMLKAIML
jgi:CheY-like chemotaxis protein